MNNIALDKTYSIEGHLSIRLVLDEDGKWYYGFLDDGLNAEKAIAKGEKLACTHLYRISEEQKIDLEDYLSKEKKADGKSLLDLICGKDKYVIQRKEFDDNTSLVALSFIGV